MSDTSVTRCLGCYRNIDPDNCAMVDGVMYCWECWYTMSAIADELDAEQRAQYDEQAAAWAEYARPNPPATIDLHQPSAAPPHPEP